MELNLSLLYAVYKWSLNRMIKVKLLLLNVKMNAFSTEKESSLSLTHLSEKEDHSSYPDTKVSISVLERGGTDSGDIN